MSEGVKHESKVVLFHGLRARGLSHEVLRKARYGLQRGETKKENEEKKEKTQGKEREQKMELGKGKQKAPMNVV